MINWYEILSNSIWLAGLALILAYLSFADYARASAGLSIREVWRTPTATPWIRLGELLFCTGMGLTSASWLERVLWSVLCLNVLFEWRRTRRRGLPVQALDLLQPRTKLSGSDNYSNGRSPVTRTAEWLIKRELLWLMLLSPFFLLPAPDRVLGLLALPTLWVARRAARGHFIPRTPIDWPIFFLMLMALVSLYATFDAAVSLQRIALLIFGVGMYYALVEWAATSGRHLELATWAYVLAGVGLAVVGLLGSQWADKLPGLGALAAQLPGVLEGLPGDEGGFNPTISGGSLLWILPLQMALFGWSWLGGWRASFYRWCLRVILLGALLLSTVMVMLAQSRSALIGLCLGFVLLLWQARSRAARMLIPALIAILVIGLAFVIYVGPTRVAAALSPIQDNAGLALLSVLALSSTWSRALYGIEDFPFTGMGMGTFYYVQPLLYPSGSLNGVTHAHNMFLQAALDLGLVGLMAYLALWMASAAMVAMAWRRQKESWGRAVVAGISACLIASFVLGMTDVGMMVPRTGFLFWALLGLLVALWKQPMPISDELKQLRAAEEEQRADPACGNPAQAIEKEAVLI
jgi:putative inorganic carbon (hco3(-)) transporter